MFNRRVISSSFLLLFFSCMIFFPTIVKGDDFDDENYGSDGYDESTYEEDFFYQDEPNNESNSPSYEMESPSSIDQSFQRETDSSFSSASSPLPTRIKNPGEKIILVDPKEHAWGAYDAKGVLVRWGLATAGANWCRDINKPCRTTSGQFRIYSLGDSSCISNKFPIPDGGAPMPYCMYFNGGQALHGSNEVVYDNVSHGCVRIHVGDAQWLRYEFVEGPNKKNHFQGTKVVISSYF